MTNDELAHACEMAWKHKHTSAGPGWKAAIETECRKRALRRRQERDSAEPGGSTTESTHGCEHPKRRRARA